jgi:hypothetical protein
MKVPFIDAGIDVVLDNNASLHGMCRVTAGLPDYDDHIDQVVSFSERPADDVYRNIQVADLNMLSAVMAVLKWKKLRGFYFDDIRELHSLYTVETHSLTKDDKQ